jgi:uracil-DNA glycosylase
MKKIKVFITILFFFNYIGVSAQVNEGAKQHIEKTKQYEVAVYYFPNYHPDSINAKWHGKAGQNGK